MNIEKELKNYIKFWGDRFELGKWLVCCIMMLIYFWYLKLVEVLEEVIVVGDV